MMEFMKQVYNLSVPFVSNLKFHEEYLNIHEIGKRSSQEVDQESLHVTHYFILLINKWAFAKVIAETEGIVQNDVTCQLRNNIHRNKAVHFSTAFPKFP